MRKETKNIGIVLWKGKNPNSGEKKNMRRKMKRRPKKEKKISGPLFKKGERETREQKN